MDNLNLITSDFGFSGNFDGHHIDKVIIVEHIDPGNEPAVIIDQGNDIAPVFFPSESVRRGPALLSPHQTSLI